MPLFIIIITIVVIIFVIIVIMITIMMMIVRSLAKIHLGQMESFELGNLDSMRDWGHARDYVEGGTQQ